MRWVWIAAIAVVGAGCGPKDQGMMPSKVGTQWTYTVRAGFQSYVEPVSVERHVSVAGVQGFELGGPLGQSRMAWREGRLVASRLGSARFDPPVPLLVPGGKGPYEWKGTFGSLAGSGQATAILEQRTETVNLGARSLPCTRATLRVERGDETIELITWFSDGTGIVKQEQRTNGRQNLALELLSGP